ncbi:HET-domain-containing protein, partial [Stipitochalara longipes BDJ]
IRLLTLHPGTPSAGISTSLSLVNLQDYPYYEALSYVWGSPNPRKPITLSGRSFTVTENLYAALEELRDTKHARVLWIDQLCINQDDLGERSSQVLLMEAIYKGCTVCWIWLGKSDPNTEKSIKILENWAKGMHLYPQYNFTRESKAAAIKLTSQPWFSRTWTVQEAVLPQRLQVLCGSYTLEWKQFADSAKNLRTHLTSECCLSQNDTANEQMTNISDFIEAVLGIERTRRLYPKNRNMLACLNDFRRRAATDPRDKVFGLLSLIYPEDSKAKKLDSLVKPSYSESPLAIYTRLCQDVVKQSGSLEVLKYVLNMGVNIERAKSGSTLRLPSWVPDWTLNTPEMDTQKGRLERYNLYAANGHHLCQPTFDEYSVLKELGVPCGIAREIGNERTPAMGEKIPEDWVILAEKNHSGGKKVARDTLWETILMDTIEQRTTGDAAGPLQRASARDYKELKDWPARIFSGIAWPPLLSRLHYTLESATLLRKFFITREGHFGIGPAALKKGDELFVLRGSLWPLALRPRNNGNYELIGDCYLHGFMDGE